MKAGLILVMGRSVCKELNRPLKVFSQDSCELSGCGTEAGLASVIEMNGGPGSAQALLQSCGNCITGCVGSKAPMLSKQFGYI
jgi:hypothetical protein